MLWIPTVILIIGLAGAMVLRRHLREDKLLRLREITHKERMMAMENNLPVPEADTSRIDALLVEGERPHPDPGANIRWIRMAALALGITSLFGGAGAIPGIYFQSDPEISGTWSMGLLPIFLGAGLLIFVRLSRNLGEKINGEENP